ncbi:hypothetical protein [Paraburkholderia phosphatilytica]|uniref:hypothetical protein n=1 Tax=Paraburkholderia phosphatilytica TaxID=2282883 RepID=UPI000E5066EF|nr:hypothetical protein [Paraburkholderia phosphatilytica]
MIFRNVIQIERARQAPPTAAHLAYRPAHARETAIAVGLFGLLPFVAMLLLVLGTTHGNFTYTLDDPYIHLALARNLWHGHYGINASELSAPSSSILWPFLLAPFATLGAAFEYVPLAINAVCLFATVAVIHRMFAGMPATPRYTITALLTLSLNLVGLVFTGMEHSLQVLLTAVAILPVLPVLRKRFEATATLPFHVIAAITLLPLVRYEGLAISVPVLAFLFVRGYRREAIVSMSIIGVVMVGFSLFLYANGLGLLPSSVMAKTGLGQTAALLANLRSNLVIYGFLAIPLAWVLRVLWRTDRARFGVVLAASVLYFLFGRNGWFGRYEVFYLLFVVAMSARLALRVGGKLLPAMLLLPLALSMLVKPTLQTPFAAANVASQQAQTARLARMLNAPVAVNDLGLVALRSGQYTLDLWGLGSADALRHRVAHDPASNWMPALMAAHHVRYAFVYSAWFPDRPASWIKVGELVLNQKRVTADDSVVSLYATDPAAAETLRNMLVDFGAQREWEAYSVKVE